MTSGMDRAQMDKLGNWLAGEKAGSDSTANRMNGAIALSMMDDMYKGGTFNASAFSSMMTKLGPDNTAAKARKACSSSLQAEISAL
jgi:hypothetical protein